MSLGVFYCDDCGTSKSDEEYGGSFCVNCEHMTDKDTGNDICKDCSQEHMSCYYANCDHICDHFKVELDKVK